MARVKSFGGFVRSLAQWEFSERLRTDNNYPGEFEIIARDCMVEPGDSEKTVDQRFEDWSRRARDKVPFRRALDRAHEAYKLLTSDKG